MMNDKWFKMDNVAKVFLATCNLRDTRSFRVSCTLKEPVDKELLQQAIEKTVKQRPQFQVLIHKGVFWHYMEMTNKEPVVEEENQRPCPYLYGRGFEGKLHYRVTYFRNRINLDMFHALTDGNGGMEFLNIIVLNYLQLKYPGKLDKVSVFSGASQADLEEDSFKHFYGKKGKPVAGTKKSYHIRGLKLPYNQLQFMEFHMSAQEMLKRAKKVHASLTSYLGAALMLAVYRDMPALQKNKPITISMPVNLRNFYPSATSRNFFNSVYVSHTFSGEETIETLAQQFDTDLKAELKPEKMKERMDNYEYMEQAFFVRMVPLFIKNPVVKFFARQESKKVTAVVSNLGRLQAEAEMEPYIQGYSAYCSTSTLFITICSYGDDLTLGVATAYRNTSVLRNFIKTFTDDGVEVTAYASEVIY